MFLHFVFAKSNGRVSGTRQLSNKEDNRPLVQREHQTEEFVSSSHENGNQGISVTPIFPYVSGKN